MAIIGSVNNQGYIQGQINEAKGVVTGVISTENLIGGQVVGMRGLQGEKGDPGDKGDPGNPGADGQDGFSPSASVSKVDNVATITITDKDGTTTAEVYDGSGGGASAFIAEYGVTSYSDVKDAYDEDAIILCKSDDSGNTAILQLAYFDDANDGFIFTEPTDDGWRWTSIVSDDTWDDGSFQFANTDTATQLRDGLMSALDKQKLDGIASGAEVNVQSDWNEADSTADDFIKNKPTIPTKVSDLNNDSGFITDKGVYVAEYGTTTHSNLCDAIDAEKAIIVSKDGILVPVSAEYAEDYYKWWIYEKPNPDSYGYNKGESDPQYLYNEEYFYDEYYDHWNVSKVYDSTIANSYPSYANLVGSSTIHLYGITDLTTFYEYTLNANDVWTATSGSGGSVQSDWNENDSTADDYIKNKPTIPSQPSDIGAQEALVSGTNIKTINNESLLGSGDITVAAGNPWASMYIEGISVNNTATKVTGLTMSMGANSTDYFDIGTSNQIKIKKAGTYKITVYFRATAITSAGNVKRISCYVNGNESAVAMARLNTWEDAMSVTFRNLNANDVLTMYKRAEDGGSTYGAARILVEAM